MSKHPNRKPLTRRHLARAVKGLINFSQVSSRRHDDIEKIFEEYLEYKEDLEGFKEYLNGKYKSEDDRESGTDSPTSEE